MCNPNHEVTEIAYESNPDLLVRFESDDVPSILRQIALFLEDHINLSVAAIHFEVIEHNDAPYFMYFVYFR